MTSDQQAKGSHRFAVQVNFDEDLDPDRVEEWCRANFTEDQSVILQDLDSDAAYKFDGGEFDEAL